ncbi:transposase [Streptomyces sp. NBC_00289]|uniref:transposase n=1 Tax=Streptomyces sp. NBC_00289 TaxID=2975703 RepID=UPI00352F810C
MARAFSSATRPATGRYRGGLTTKVHLAPDDRCRPLASVLTAGQAGDARAITHVMARLRVARPRGRPRTRPDVVLADDAYSSRAIRAHLRNRGIKVRSLRRVASCAERRRPSPGVHRGQDRSRLVRRCRRRRW